MPKENQSGETDRHLLEMLVCPVSGGPLTLSRKDNELVSSSARLAFPIRDGIPVMIESEARKLPVEKKPVPPGNSKQR